MNEFTDSTTTAAVRGRASKLKRRLQEDGKEKIETGKRAAADQIAEIADAIDVAGAQLDQSQPTLANYASKIADSVGSLATRLREDSIEDLYGEMRQAATRHPGMFLLGSAALGLVLARFMKASGEEQHMYAGEDLGEVEELEDEQRAEASDTDTDTDTVDVAQNPSFYGQSGATDSPGTTPRGV